MSKPHLLPCECTGPGRCDAAGRVVSPHEFALCRDRPQLRSVLRTLHTQIQDGDLPCGHRGEVARHERCRLDQCVGGPMFQVFSCSIHGECSLINRAVPGLTVCKKCGDRIS